MRNFFIDDLVIFFLGVHSISSFLHSFFPYLQMFYLSLVTYALMSSSQEGLFPVLSPWVVCNGLSIFGNPLGPIRWSSIGFVMEFQSDGGQVLWDIGQ